MKLNAYSAVLILLILATTAIGAWFYWEQLGSTPIWLWFFVPDCPLYALLGATVLLFGFPKSAKLRFLISCGLAIYGSWTIFVLVSNYAIYFAPEQALLTLVLIAGHAGMVFKSLLVLPRKDELKIGALLAAFGWFLMNLYLDYFNGKLSTHPWVPTSGLDTVIMFTAASSLILPVALFAMSGIAGENKWLVFLKKKFYMG